MEWSFEVEWTQILCGVVGITKAPGANLHPGTKFAPLASRSYANKSCPYVPRFYLKFNKRFSVLWSNSLFFF